MSDRGCDLCALRTQTWSIHGVESASAGAVLLIVLCYSLTCGAQTDEKSWDKIFEVNLKAAFLLAKEFVPHMERGSSILFVASIGVWSWSIGCDANRALID